MKNLFLFSAFAAIMTTATAEPWTVTFDLNGGTLVSGSLIQQVEHGKDAELPIVEREGFVLNSWVWMTADAHLNVTSDRTITAWWNDIPGTNYVDVLLINNSGSYSQTKLAEGATFTFPANPFEKIGYTFVEWNTHEDGSGIGYQEGNVITNVTTDRQFYVIWTEDISVPKWTVTFSVQSTGGTIYANAGGDIESGTAVHEGQTVQFHVNKDYGYRLKEWIHNGTVVTDHLALFYEVRNLNADLSIVVVFEQIPTYTLTFGVEGIGGTLRAEIGSTPISSGVAVPESESVSFIASPDAKYRVKEWRHNGQPVDEHVTNYHWLPPYQEADITVTVVFELLPAYTLTYSVVGIGGTLTASLDDSYNTPVESGETVVENNWVVLTATPNVGGSIQEWRRNGELFLGYTFTRLNVYMDEDIVITVEFVKPTLGGILTIDGGSNPPQFGQTLTANIDGLTTSYAMEDMGEIEYKWWRSSEYVFMEDLVGTSSSYTITDADIGYEITLSVETANTVRTVYARTSQITKADNTAIPVAPIMDSRSETSITLVAVDDVEYCIADGNWQISPIFNDLTPATAYTFYARFSETATHFASLTSAATVIETETANPTTDVRVNNYLPLRLYPNPVVNTMLIESSELKAGEFVQIYTVGGTLVGMYTTKGERTTLNLSHLLSGVYLIKIGGYTERIVKQ